MFGLFRKCYISYCGDGNSVMIKMLFLNVCFFYIDIVGNCEMKEHFLASSLIDCVQVHILRLLK